MADLWGRLIAIATKDIAQEVRAQILALGDEAAPEEIHKVIMWGQEESRRRLEEAKLVVKEEIPEEEKTKKIFKIMLGNLFDDYTRRYKEDTGEDF